MDQKEKIKLSKTLSRILRHDIGKGKAFSCDDKGFVRVSEILHKIKCTIDDIIHVVESNEKKRFTLEERDGEYFIKANQGHSLSSGKAIIDSLSLTEITEPFAVCIHGTESRFMDSILSTGLNRMRRKHIHFVGEIDKTRQISGFKHKSDKAIYIDMALCMAQGMHFYMSDNNVILTEGLGGVILPKYFKEIIDL